MIAAGYIRTSSPANVGEGKDSYNRQRLAISTYANANNLVISDDAYCYDAGILSKVPFAVGPAWRQLIDHCRAKHAYTIVFVVMVGFSFNLTIYM